MIRKIAVLGVVATAGLLTACSSSGGGDKKSSSSAPTASTSSSATASSTITQPPSLPAPSSVPSLIKLFTRDSCTATKTGWQMGGTAKSPTTDITYRATVYFTTSGGTVVAYGQKNIAVAKGKTVNWTVAANFKAPANVRCVLVGVSKAG